MESTRSWTSAATGRHARRGRSPRIHWTFRGAGNVRGIARAPRTCQRPLALGPRRSWQDCTDAGVGRSRPTSGLDHGSHRWPRCGAYTASFAAAVESRRWTARDTRLAVFIDTYERLEALDDWLRENYLRSLPAGTLVALASRHLPGVEWRTDPGWAAVLRGAAASQLPS